jgi:hypothetical protein
LLTAMVFAFAPMTAIGQSSLDPGRLPKSTAFYLAWHGTPPIDARNATPCWRCGTMQILRRCGPMIEEIMQESASSKSLAH